MKVVTIRDRKTGTELVLVPGKDHALAIQGDTHREIPVTRWLHRDNLPPVPIVGLNGHSEQDVAEAVVRALR